MKIKIGEWLIDGASGDWVVCKETTKTDEDTGEVKDVQGQNAYYGTLYQSMLCVFNRKLSEADAKDAKEIVDTINAVGKEIKEAAETAEGLLRQIIESQE